MLGNQNRILNDYYQHGAAYVYRQYGYVREINGVDIHGYINPDDQWMLDMMYAKKEKSPKKAEITLKDLIAKLEAATEVLDLAAIRQHFQQIQARNWDKSNADQVKDRLGKLVLKAIVTPLSKAERHFYPHSIRDSERYFIVRYLINQGANLQNSALVEYAVRNNRTQVLDLLLANGAPVDSSIRSMAQNKDDYEARYQACLAILNKYIPPVKPKLVSPRQALTAALSCLDEQAVKTLIVEHQFDDDKPLMTNCLLKLCQLSIAHAAQRGSLFHHTNNSPARQAHENLVRLFLDNGAKVDAALQHAVDNNHVGATRLLLAHGADITEEMRNDIQRASDSLSGSQAVVRDYLNDLDFIKSLEYIAENKSALQK